MPQVVAHGKRADYNDSWVVMAAVSEGPDEDDSLEGQTLQTGDVVRLKHKMTKRYLRMADFNGPKTTNHPAASCYSMDWDDRRMAADESEESTNIDHWIVEADANAAASAIQPEESVEYMCISLQALEVAVDGDIIPALAAFGEACQPSEYATATLGKEAAANETAELAVEKPTYACLHVARSACSPLFNGCTCG
jgi:hypothetical protein